MKPSLLEAILTELRDNLYAQNQAMLADNLQDIVHLSQNQQSLFDALESHLSGAPSQRTLPNNASLLAEINELLQTNELLARQSLAYARRMLEVFDGAGFGQGPGTGLDRQG